VRVRGKTVVPLRELPSQRVTCLLAGPDEQVYVGTDHGLVLWNLNYAQNERCERWFRAAEVVAG
jgi:hypothetical protein